MENRKYLCTITTIYYDDNDQSIYSWYENAKKQTMFNWTEHVIKYEDWKRPFDSMKKRRNFRFLKIGEPFWKDPESIHVNEWELGENRDPDKNEKIMSSLWKK
jgi:hypothetical protein